MDVEILYDKETSKIFSKEIENFRYSTYPWALKTLAAWVVYSLYHYLETPADQPDPNPHLFRYFFGSCLFLTAAFAAFKYHHENGPIEDKINLVEHFKPLVKKNIRLTQRILQCNDYSELKNIQKRLSVNETIMTMSQYEATKLDNKALQDAIQQFCTRPISWSQYVAGVPALISLLMFGCLLGILDAKKIGDSLANLGENSNLIPIQMFLNGVSDLVTLTRFQPSIAWMLAVTCGTSLPFVLRSDYYPIDAPINLNALEKYLAIYRLVDAEKVDVILAASKLSYTYTSKTPNSQLIEKHMSIEDLLNLKANLSLFAPKETPTLQQ